MWKEYKYSNKYNLSDYFLSSINAFVASFRVFSISFPVLQKPCLVLPNELGPADVGVSLPIFLMRILASLGISSGSSSLTSPNTAATDLDAGLGRTGGSFYNSNTLYIYIINAE